MSNETGTPMTPEEMVSQLRTLRAQIPEYVQVTSSFAATKRRVAAIDEAFVHATINAVGASPAMQDALGQTSDELRQEADALTRWSAVKDELRAMFQGITAANLTRRHRLGRTALQAYGISKLLVREPEHAYLLPHLQEMKRLNRLGHPRRRKGGGGTTPEAPTPKSTAPVHVPQ
jgi:hypothetical protein